MILEDIRNKGICLSAQVILVILNIPGICVCHGILSYLGVQRGIEEPGQLGFLLLFGKNEIVLENK